MARIIKNSDKTIISCIVTTEFTDGTKATKELKVGEVVEGLRYVKGEEVVSVTGKVTAINVYMTKATNINITKPVDYFSTDVVVKNIVIDCSKEYEADTVTVPAMEIVEDEGIVDVERVYVTSYARETMDMSYTDGTIVNQDIEVNDVLTNCKIMTTPGYPDITGDFRIAAWAYKVDKTVPNIYGVYLVPLTGGNAKLINFKNFISFVEADSTQVTDTNSLASISEALAASETGEVYAQLGVDVTIPIRDDGKITTTMINEGKTLNLDLAGHNIECQAYAFYVNGGTLNISNTSGEGSIICKAGDKKAYPAVYVNSGGVCNMDSGIIDTTQAEVPEGSENWLYGVVCANDGVFNMTGGKMIIQGASGISITNGTATGEGAKFTIGGDAEISSVECVAVYLADNKSVVIKDNAVLNGGMVLRMGDISIEDKAVVNSHKDPSIVYPLGEQVVLSGVGAPSAAILALTGCYGSDLGNDLNIKVAKTAKLNGYIDEAIDIATMNTRFDQKVDVDIESADSIKSTANPWRVYDHDELAALAEAEGKHLAAEAASTDLTIKIGGTIVYPEVTG